jgi:hypothetical protein
MAKLFNGGLEVVAADEPRRVERTAVVQLAQAVNQHDSRVFESTSNLGLDEEAGAIVLVVGLGVLNAFQGHVAACGDRKRGRLTCDSLTKPPC